jgi:hypothetical protein
LVALSPGTATVEIDAGARRFVAQQADDDGETVEKLVEIAAGKRRICIAPTTEIEALP